VSTLPRNVIRTDGGTQSRAEIDQHVTTEYAAAMKDGAVFPPVVVFFDGSEYWLADGFHRLRAVYMTDEVMIAADVRQGTQRDAVLYSVGANASHGLRRTNADKRRAVETLCRDEEWGKWSDREIARRCGVDHKTVAPVRAELSGELPQIEDRLVQRGGTTYPMSTAAIGRPAVEPAPGWNEAGEPIVRRDDPAQVAAFLGKPAGQAAASPAPVPVAPRGPVPTSESNEWYTPAAYVEAAREVLGAIDLDPATCEAAQATVRAERYYTELADGLSRAWVGRVFLNPPYGVDDERRSNQGRWSERLIAGHVAGEIPAAVLVVNALTSAPWFRRLWDFPICFTDHRVRFDQPEEAEKRDAPMNGTAFVYLGPDVEKFARVFGQFGAVVRRIQ